MTDNQFVHLCIYYSKGVDEFMSHTIDLKSQTLSISSVASVDTISDLLSLNNLSLNTVIKVTGYYTATDGATHYRIVSNTDNGSGIAYNNLYLNILYTNELYSTWFGCKQDGITDDTINFQRFLNFFGKAKLYVPKGIIKISSMLTIMGMFRNATGWDDNRSYRTLEFQGAAFDWYGTENECSINIFCHYNSIIDGVAFVHNSRSNFVNICAVWDSQIKNFYIDTLKFNNAAINSNTKLPYGLTDFDIYYQFNNVFTFGCILKNVIINSTAKNITDKTYGINSLKFNNVAIGSKNCNYCVEIYGDKLLNNVGFNNCDLSYASKALFYLEKENPNCTITLNSCYFDSALPLTEDYNYKYCNFNLYNNYEASNDSKQIFALKTINFTNSIKLGDKGIEPNYLPMGVMNLALNGDLSYATISWDWIRNVNVPITMVDRTYGIHGKVVSMTFSGNGKYVEFPLVSYTPFTGMYTLGLRLKKVSGTGIIQFSYNNNSYKNYDMSLLNDNDDFIVASYGNSTKIFSQGDAIKCVLSSVTDTTQLILELIEIIALPGKQILFNLPLAPTAQIKVTSTTQIHETNVVSVVNTTASTTSSYAEDILFKRIEDIAYYGVATGNLPSYVTTKHIICDKQTLGMYDMLASKAIHGLLQKSLGVITHNLESNRQVALPLTIGHYADTYYVTIRVDSISANVPSLTLYNVNSTNSEQVLSNLQATTGIQKLSVKVGGGNLTAASICEPMIGISKADVAAGKYITYEILGIYDSNLLGNDENFINDIKFAGSPIKRSDALGFDIVLNNERTTIDKEIRCLNGVSDYIRDGKLHRRIKKLLITGDMILDYEPSWTEKYTIGEKSSFVFLKPELNYGFNNSMLPQKASESYVIAPGFSRYTLSTGHGDKNIRSIGAAIPYGVGIEQYCITVRLRNTDLGVESNANLSTAEIINLFSDWFAKNPTYIYYACLDEEVEDLNVTLPTLNGNKTINTLYFTTNKSMGVYPHIRVQRQVSPYMNLDGKSWLAIGDSLTAADGASLAYMDLASYLIPNCITYNYGKSGASIAPYTNVNNRAVGKWIDEAYDTLPEYVSLITIMLGTNDRQTDLVIGTVEDTLAVDTGSGSGVASTSFLAYYKHLILKLYEKYPEAEIVLLTPPRNSKFADTTVINNKAQNTFGDIIQAVKDLAAYLCLRCYDMNHESGVNQLASSSTLKLSWLAKRTNFLTVDGLHYNDLGHELLFRYITSVL